MQLLHLNIFFFFANGNGDSRFVMWWYENIISEMGLSRKRTKHHTFAIIEASIMYHLNANAQPLASVCECVSWTSTRLALLGLKVWVGETGVKRWDKKREIRGSKGEDDEDDIWLLAWSSLDM